MVRRKRLTHGRISPVLQAFAPLEWMNASFSYNPPLIWTFSIYLEAIAIIPQLIVLQRYRIIENLPGTLLSDESLAIQPGR